MTGKSPLSDDEKTIPRLFLDLLWQVWVLVGPVFLVAYFLPPLLAIAVFVVLAMAMWGFARMGWIRAGRRASGLIFSTAFGMGFTFLDLLPAYWDVALGAAGVVGGLAFASYWESRLGLSRPASENSGARGGALPQNGRSNWGGGEATLTPEGEPIQSFNLGEIAMGGPTYCDYLFPDGVLLEGVGTTSRFSRDARYFASPVPYRSGWQLAIFDRRLRRLYRCEARDTFWELDEFADIAVSAPENERDKAPAPATPAEASKPDLAAWLAVAKGVDLVPIADLWVEPGSWQTKVAVTTFERQSPDGRHRLTGSLYLPPSLRALPDPTGPLRRPEYRVDLDGVPSGLLMAADAVMVWRDDAQALCCHARSEHSAVASPYWYWEAGQPWRALPQPWARADGEPSFAAGEPLALDARMLRIAAYLDYSQPDHGAYGYALHSIHGDTQTVVGHDAKGRMQVADVRLTRTQLLVPVSGKGARGECSVESEPLSDGLRARFDWLRDNAAEQGAYTCTIGDWILPGEWLLDHRVSDCGRYVALVPFVSPAAAPGHVCVADTRELRLLQSPPLLAARLLDFRAGRLSLSVVWGRLRKDAKSTPLHRIDMPPPDASRAADFYVHTDDSRLYYEVNTLQLIDGGLTLLPAWRQVSRPQLANADGDFVQPSPDGRDAACLFGAETDYADSWLRARESRLGGYVLTASGCGVADLAPSMIWSRGSCYLALTRMQTDVYEQDDNRTAWRVLLLDVEKRTLRQWPEWLYSRPVFDSFAATALHIRVFVSDWEDIGRNPRHHDAGTVTSIDLKAFLDLPAEPLVACGDLWLPASEQSNAEQWLALDRAPLFQWTTQRTSLISK